MIIVNLTVKSLKIKPNHQKYGYLIKVKRKSEVFNISIQF